MATPGMPEPMNATTHHAKVKVSLSLAGGVVVAGEHAEGTMEMECRADAGLGIGTMMVELFAVQELTSRDHSATLTFLHTRRLFQGPGLPPSNAVHAHPLPGDQPLPTHYLPARRGISRFPFRVPIPRNAPASISFGGGLAGVRYELRASAEVFWKKERRVVLERREVGVVQACEENMLFGEVQEPEATVVGENGKVWVQGRVVGGVVVMGESACVELQVKNHSAKKTTSLTLSLTRSLHLQTESTTSSSQNTPAPLQITDTPLTVPFRGPEYVVPAGAEGVARLVFDVPVGKGGVKGGVYGGEEEDAGGSGSGEYGERGHGGHGGHGEKRGKEALFEVKCEIVVRMGMGLGSKDIIVAIPISILHPAAVPVHPPQHHHHPYPHAYPHAHPYPALSPAPTGNPYPYADPYPYQYASGMASPQPMMSPPVVSPGPGMISPPLPHPMSPMPYLDPAHNQVWLPPPVVHLGYEYHHPHAQQAHFPPAGSHALLPPGYIPVRPSSAGVGEVPLPLDPHHLPHQQQYNHTTMQYQQGAQQLEPEEGKAPLAQRVSQHLRMSSRNRSVSPVSHRFPGRGLPLPPIHDAGASGPGLPLPAIHDLVSGGFSPPISPSVNGVVHSPRPHPSPTLSYSGGDGYPFPDSRPIPKSARVAELERMADGVVRRDEDLSGDLPRVSGHRDGRGGEGKEGKKDDGEEEADRDVNKTLPAPPVPGESGKLAVQRRMRVKEIFAPAPATVDPIPPENTLPDPIPSDKTPPTPTLTATAVLRGVGGLLGVNGWKDKETGAGDDAFKGNGKDKVKGAVQESGLDALERRLLAEVGTRKHLGPLLRAGGGAGEEDDEEKGDGLGNGAAQPIAIPPKSPEPLNDSAISSLSLAAAEDGGRQEPSAQQQELSFSPLAQERHESLLAEAAGAGRTFDFDFLRGDAAGDAEDHDSDVKTHRAGKSSMASDMSGGRSHYGERGREKEKRKEGRKKERDSGKEKKEKRDGEKMRKNAKGRVAAWLGRIDPAIPPPEDVIPPSPSVARAPGGEAWEEPSSSSVGAPVLPLSDMPKSPRMGTLGKDHNIAAQKEQGKEEDARIPAVANVGLAEDTCAPNPRSSGFVPIGTLKRDTFHQRPLAEDASVIQEARRVADLWSSSSAPKEKEKLKYSVAAAQPASIRTNRRVSPPSASPAHKPGLMSSPISGMTRDIWKRADPGPRGAARRPAAIPKAGQQQRVPLYPPPPLRQDPEAKYDVRSARGGRGGKVTAVASLWASAAGGSTESKGLNVKRTGDGPLPKPLAGRASGKLPPSDVAVTIAAAGQSKPRERVLRSPPPPPPVPVKLAMPLGMLSSTRVAASSAPKTNMDNNHITSSVGGTERKDFATRPTNFTLPVKSTRLPAKLTPPSTAVSTPTAGTRTPTPGEPKLLDLAGKRTKPVVKSSSVPAIISSSHATPTLSSTASLARPHAPANALKPDLPNKLPKVASAPHLDSVKPSVPRPMSPPKPTPKGDLAFGQARLRDLIKKYQGQGT